MSDVRFVYVTTRDADEARELARRLLEERLIACANILPQMESVYRWEGEIRFDSEAVLILKTDADRVENVIKSVDLNHSYDTPCALSFAIETGSEKYMSWIKSELSR